MIRAAVLYAAALGASLGLLTVVGYPVGQLCAGGRSRRPRVPSPVLGLAVLQLFAWYWLRFTDLSFSTGVRALLVVSAVGCGLCWRRWGRPRPQPDWVLPAACSVGCLALLALYFSTVLSLGTPTTFSAYNADAVSYVLHAQDLNDHGLHEPGNIAGLDFRDSLRRGFGAYAGLAAVPALLGRPVWNFGGAFLLTAVFLGIYSTAWLLRQLTPLSALTASALAGLPTLSLLFAYVTSQYFLAQLLTMAVLPVVAVLLLWAAEKQPLADRAGVILPLGLLVFGILATYAHIAFLAPPVLAGGAVLAAHGLVRRSLRVVASLSVAFVGAVLVAPPVTDVAVETLRYLGTVEAGWPLSGFLPVDLLGLTRTVNPLPNGARWIWSSLLLLVFGLATAVIWRGHRVLARFAAATVTFALLSYLVVYLREGGPTYRQWKWITLYEQVIVALFLAVVVTAGVALWSSARPRRNGFMVTLLAIYAAALVFVSRSEPGPGAHNWRPIKTATSRYSIGNRPVLKGLSEVNIAAFDKWDAMWLAYFLRDKTTYLLEPTYFPISAPKAQWTVERSNPVDQPVASARIDRADAITLNNVFRLVTEDRSCAPSSAGEGLSSELSVSLDSLRVGPGSVVTGHVRARNVGTACWLPSATQRGGVLLGADLGNESGGVTSSGFFRTGLVPEGMRPVRPGDSVSVDFTLEVPPPGRHVLRFRLVSEGVALFGQEVAITVDVG